MSTELIPLKVGGHRPGTWSVDDVDVSVLPPCVGAYGCRLESKGRGMVRKVATPTHRTHLYMQ